MNRLAYALSTDAAAALISSWPCTRLCRLTAADVAASSVHTVKRPLENLAHDLLARVETIHTDVSEAAAAIHTTHKRDHCPACFATENIQKVLGQLQRGDEGMTTQKMCGNCGTTWHAK